MVVLVPVVLVELLTLTRPGRESMDDTRITWIERTKEGLINPQNSRFERRDLFSKTPPNPNLL